MICLSYSGTRNLIKRLSCEHDISVQFWSHELSSNLKVGQVFNSNISYIILV